VKYRIKMKHDWLKEIDFDFCSLKSAQKYMSYYGWKDLTENTGVWDKFPSMPIHYVIEKYSQKKLD
jgi:hypothetical protein